VSNPYATLGVSPHAPLAEIKLAWKRLALQFHPDRNSDPSATAHFRRVQSAWEQLRDDRAAVNARLVREAQEARRMAAERIRLEAERQAHLDRLARAVMDAELRREMEECPRRDLYDVRFYGEPLKPQSKPGQWRGENRRTMVWDLVNLLMGR